MFSMIVLWTFSTESIVENITPTGQKNEFSTVLYLVIEILYCTKNENHFQYRPQRCQKYASQEIKLGIKVVWNWISYKKVSERYLCLPPPQSGARGLERLIWLKYYIVLNRKITFRHILVCVNPYICVCKVLSNILWGEGGVCRQMFPS